jgi:hypothetical protein
MPPVRYMQPIRNYLDINTVVILTFRYGDSNGLPYPNRLW